MSKKKKKQKIKVKAAHRFFSADCFNKTWNYIDLPDRTADQEEEMLRLALASHWHWTQRKDYEPTNASIANWQVSRVFALLGQANNARRFGLRSLEAIENEDVPPFYIGYAFEALARAEAVSGDGESMQAYIDKARGAAAQVIDEDSKGWLLNDLDTIQV
jgi:hypothetical protein